MKDTETDNSSSDDNNQMLREALDPSMFCAKSAPTGIKEPKRSNSYKDNILNVTPQFQNFVAKRLSAMLDKTIKEFQPQENNFKPDRSAGIRLFSDSKSVLKDTKFRDIFDDYDKDTDREHRKKGKRKLPIAGNKEEELELLEKAREVAVSAEWVMKKEGTKGWSRSKGEIFEYRQNGKGELELQAKSSS